MLNTKPFLLLSAVFFLLLTMSATTEAEDTNRLPAEMAWPAVTKECRPLEPVGLVALLTQTLSATLALLTSALAATLGTSVSPGRPPTCPTSSRRPARLPTIPGQRTLWAKPFPAALQETFSTPRETRPGRLTSRRPAIRLEHDVAGSLRLP